MVSVLLLLGVTSVASAVNTACTFQSNTDYSHGGDRVQTPAVSIVELQLRRLLFPLEGKSLYGNQICLVWRVVCRDLRSI